MDLIKIALIFAVIIVIIKLKKPLYVAMAGGVIAALIIYQVPFSTYPSILMEGIFGRTTRNMILAFYSITFLQRMLEKRGRLMLAEKSISRIFNSRRVNAMVVPFIIGMLPSVGAVLIASPIVVSAAGEYLDKDETTFATSYFRHISEAFVPTYSSIILALSLTGISMSGFVLAMIPLVFALFLIGYFIYIRKIPKGGEDQDIPVDKKEEWKNVFKSMWAIVLTVMIILIFKIPVHFAVLGVIILNFFVDKFTFEEISPFFVSALEPKLILTTIIVMMFSKVLVQTGMIERLPDYFINSPIPPSVIYAILFFFGTVLAGSQAIIAIIMPLAFSTIPNAGLAYFTLLMSLTYIAMQISPAHVCLGVVTENAGTSFDGLVRKTMPVLISFIVLTVVYTYALSFITGG